MQCLPKQAQHFKLKRAPQTILYKWATKSTEMNQHYNYTSIIIIMPRLANIA